MSKKLHRRGVLRGLLGGGTLTVALPFLDCFLTESGTALAAGGAPLPVRFGTWFWGLGVTPERWIPGRTGANYELKAELAALAPFAAKMSVLSGFDVLLDGASNFPHTSGNIGLRTGVAPQKAGEPMAASLDVLIADAIGQRTRFRSLEVTSAADAKHSYSFRGPGITNPAEPSPLGLYARIFGPEFQDPNAAEFNPDLKTMVRKSVLSVVSDDRLRLEQRVGQRDRQRLDQYFTAVRQLEGQLELQLQKPPPAAACKVPGKGKDSPLDTDIEHVRANHRLLSELLAMALACNQTRVFNMVLSPTTSDLRRAGDNTAHHQVTHEEPIDRELGYQPKCAWYAERSMAEWAVFLAALDAIPEGDGTLLDQCVVLAHSDTLLARTHNVAGVPMMLAGRGGGKLKQGRHIAGNGEPVTRVGLTLMQMMGVALDRWGEKSMQTDRPLGDLFA